MDRSVKSYRFQETRCLRRLKVGDNGDVVVSSNLPPDSIGGANSVPIVVQELHIKSSISSRLDSRGV
jgi:hypothetical protein